MQTRAALTLGLLSVLGPVLGCPAAVVTHIPDPLQKHMAIAWYRDFETAKDQAMLEQKPLLLVGASGDVDGLL